jgi:ferrous iron transport protein A
MKASTQARPQTMEAGVVPLCDLCSGQSGCVGQVVGSRELVHRLREMGLYEGARIEMIRPGSPCIVRLQGLRLGFRMDDCAHVMVRVGAAAI